jgi:hypothetical protein
MGHFSPVLCTIAARYRASEARIFGHLFAAKLEILSLHRGQLESNTVERAAVFDSFGTKLGRFVQFRNSATEKLFTTEGFDRRCILVDYYVSPEEPPRPPAWRNGQADPRIRCQWVAR